MCALLGLMQSHICSTQSTCYLACLQNEAMSHQQLLRSVLAALANPATFSKGLFMAWQQLSEEAEGAGAPAARQPPMQAAWRKHCPVVFVDATGWLNLAGSMSRAALAQVRCSLGHTPGLQIPGGMVSTPCLKVGVLMHMGVASCFRCARATRDTHAEHFAQATSLSLELVPLALPTQCHAPEGSAMSCIQPTWSLPAPWAQRAAAGISRVHAT